MLNKKIVFMQILVLGITSCSENTKNIPITGADVDSASASEYSSTEGESEMSITLI